tara:strand:- start:449 stop:1588 length:1140 start_codon:yes stop_codon:yes gene_type:complete
MADYTTIDDPSAHFQVATYTGNTSAPRNITNDGNSNLKPDLIWGKNRTTAGTNNIITNSTLGFDPANTDSLLSTDSSGGVNTPNPTYGYVSAALTDGFTIASGGTNDDSFNENSSEFVAWQWKANGGTTASNTTGNGIDSVVQANTTAGFSIVTYDGNGTQSGQTVGHGLGAVPKMILSKDRDATSNVPNWRVYHQALGNTKYMTLDTDAAVATYNDWDNTDPTSSVYSVGGAGGYTPTNTNNTEYIAFVFAEVQGFSKFGSYIANGNADGPFVYTGFKPSLLILRNSTNSGYNWWILDNKRNAFNLTDEVLYTNLTAAEFDGSGHASNMGVDFLSNGFKVRTTNTAINNTGATNIYMAWAENPFVTSTSANSIPTTAR